MAYGLALAAAPGSVIRACGGPDDRRPPGYRAAAWLRGLAEGALLLGRAHGHGHALERPWTACTGQPRWCATRDRRHRRLALTNAVVATLLALEGAREAG
jgi:hypothetical protein